MMAFMGVRISWLILERKFDFAFVATSASSFAFCSAISASFRSVMSSNVPVSLTTFLSASKGITLVRRYFMLPLGKTTGNSEV